jgi:hypothetical protein
VLIADGNTLDDLQPLMAKVLQLLPNAADHRVRAFRPPRQRASAAGRVRRRQQIDT